MSYTLDQKQLDRFDDILQKDLIDNGVRCVFLIDMAGNIITNLTRRQQYEFWNKYRQELKDQAQIEYAEEIKEAMQVPVRSAQPVQPGPSN